MSNNNIKNLIKIAKGFIKEKWLETKDAPKDKVQEIKDFFFIPTLNKILFLSLECVEYDDVENFKLTLSSFKEIYELANYGNLGYSGPITEWIQDNNKRNVKAKDHLSWTVPSKETLKRFYILAAFISKGCKYQYLKMLCDLEAEKETNGQYISKKLLFFPNFNHESGEGTLTSVFDESRELIVNNATLLKSYFDNSHESALNFTCRGDFLIEYYYFMNDLAEGWYIRFLNFPRFYYERVSPLLQKIIMRPNEFNTLTQYSEKKFTEFIKHVVEFSRAHLFEYASDWSIFVLPEVQKMLSEKKE